MKIGLDFDGVIADSLAAKVTAAREMFAVSIPPDLCERKLIMQHQLLTEEQYDEVNRRVFSGRGVAIEEIHQACLYIQILQAHRYNIRVVTSRSNSDRTLACALEWLRVKNQTLKVSGVGYKKSKVDACRGLDVFVDDDLEKLVPLVGTVNHLLLFSSPTNRDHEMPSGIHRVDNWWELYNYIREGGFR
ncbi:MAG: hypothetical protein NTV02_01010 [Candidatus Zambryskibacteria bacterium]|nr:hypothetical protein [Candidatus Zambryskibacteria bacterium]